MRKSRQATAKQPGGLPPLRLLFATVLAGLLLSGCGTYHSGAGYQPPFQAIYPAPVQTEAFSPGFARLLDDSLRQVLQRDQRVRLVSPEQAEVVLQVHLIEFSEDLSAFSPQDSGRPVSMRNRIIARLDLGPPDQPKALLDQRLVEAQIRLYSPEDSAFHSARFQSQPALARQLAERIRDAVMRVGAEH